MDLDAVPLAEFHPTEEHWGGGGFEAQLPGKESSSAIDLDENSEKGKRGMEQLHMPHSGGLQMQSSQRMAAN